MARHTLTPIAVAMLIATSSPLTAQPASSQRVITWLVFVDDLHLDFRNTGRIRDLLRTIARELIHEGDSFAVRSSGPSAIAVDLTSGRALLESAVRKVTGNGLKPSDIIQADPRAPSEVRYRASIALTAAGETVRDSPSADRPTVMIYISNGYDIGEPSDTSEIPPARSRGGPPHVSVAEVRAQLAALQQAASHAGMHIFAIDPRGLVDRAPPDQTLDLVSWQKHLTTTRYNLSLIAEQSGGFTIVHPSDLADGLKRIRSQMRD